MSTSTHPSVRRVTALALASGAALSAAALTPAHAATAARAGETLHAKLTASGDPDGSGSATFRIVKAKGKVCVTATWKNIQTPNSAHIHKKSDSLIVVDLTSAVTGGAHCATGVSHRLIGRILAHPRRYYFNVHNATYPAGAIQGTLHR
ncbi:MAG: hypothetical protein QOH37_1773 [Nocardioidaceae bacterium]|jgi:hypothetical protein|nr:hypothetical protein [Nocardioidaceae bacterium]